MALEPSARFIDTDLTSTIISPFISLSLTPSGQPESERIYREKTLVLE